MNTDNQTQEEKKQRNEALGQLLAELLDEDFERGGMNSRRQLPIKAMLTSLWRHRKLFYKVLPATFVVAAILTLSVPNYYNCTVMLAPELSTVSGKTSSLASIASSFGINLGGSSSSGDALMPTLYPDLMNSVAFRASLFPIKVQCPTDNDSVRVEMNYYDYLENEQRLPWWSAGIKAAIKGLVSLFKDEEEDKGFDPFQLTKEQFEIVKLMEKKVSCDVDKKTMVITINVTDQDAYIAATMADSVQHRLQDFITDYRTRKARVDLEHYKKLYAEAKADYEKALNKNAAYSDANQRVFLQSVRSQETRLSNEVSLQYQAYSQVAAQLKLAEAKVQEDTPAFTTLQPATVPVKKAGPKRAILCLVYLFLAFCATSAYIFNKDRASIFTD